MPDIQIQFHALRAEIVRAVMPVAADADLHLLGVTYQPFVGAPIPTSAEAMNDERIDRIIFTMIPPTLGATMNQLLDDNPGAMILDIGRETAAALGESCFSVRTVDHGALRIARRLAEALRTSTHAGAVATNPSTGASFALRNHRFSDGAAKLELAGKTMSPVAGNSILSFAKQAGLH